MRRAIFASAAVIGLLIQDGFGAIALKPSGYRMSPRWHALVGSLSASPELQKASPLARQAVAQIAAEIAQGTDAGLHRLALALDEGFLEIEFETPQERLEELAFGIEIARDQMRADLRAVKAELLKKPGDADANRKLAALYSQRALLDDALREDVEAAVAAQEKYRVSARIAVESAALTGAVSKEDKAAAVRARDAKKSNAGAKLRKALTGKASAVPANLLSPKELAIAKKLAGAAHSEILRPEQLEAKSKRRKTVDTTLEFIDSTVQAGYSRFLSLLPNGSFTEFLARRLGKDAREVPFVAKEEIVQAIPLADITKDLIRPGFSPAERYLTEKGVAAAYWDRVNAHEAVREKIALGGRFEDTSRNDPPVTYSLPKRVGLDLLAAAGALWSASPASAAADAAGAPDGIGFAAVFLIIWAIVGIVAAAYNNRR